MFSSETWCEIEVNFVMLGWYSAIFDKKVSSTSAVLENLNTCDQISTLVLSNIWQKSV